MATITVLDQNTINKIAAGEVIERPASVVKELLENAIDAQATAVTVEIRDGGTSMIRVTDNGSGIPKDQIGLAFLRHATSKIRAVEDLFTISSLGFRGEALASIAAVSQVELITKTGDSLTGFRYQIEGGKEKGLEEVGAPEGTTFIARNLFYNTPVRKKFLKSPMTEGGYVADLVEKIALSHPELSVRFIQNNQNKLYTSGNHNLRDLVYTVYGREVTANLLPVEGEEGEIRIGGFIGKPLIGRGNRNYENYFINGRYIKSGIISRAIEEAYKPYLMQHKYPFTLLHFTIAQDFLDVNVHPTKMELRFKDNDQVYRAVYNAVKEALAEKELIPKVTLREEKEEKASQSPAEHVRTPHPEPFEQKRKALLGGAAVPVQPALVRESGRSYGVGKLLENSPKPQPESPLPPLRPQSPQPQPSETEGTPAQREPSMPQPAEKQHGEKHPPKEHPPKEQPPVQMDLFEEKFLDPASRKRHRLIGQVFGTYWMVEYDGQLIIIDQHAAHEKILYENTMNNLKTREFDTQMISPPIILTLSTNEALLLERYMDQFTRLGFEIEGFGGREFAVRGVPSNLLSIAKKELLMEMLDELTEEGISGEPDLICQRVASMSCKAAVKGNHDMSPAEADALIDQLLKLENPYHCPHGRPVMMSMTKYELEKKFKRIV